LEALGFSKKDRNPFAAKARTVKKVTGKSALDFTPFKGTFRTRRG
jgi:hypothetical protein